MTWYVVRVVMVVKFFDFFSGRGGRALSGKLSGAGRDMFDGVTHTITKGSGISSRILSGLRRILVASSMKMRAALGVVGHVRGQTTRSGCMGARRLGSVLHRRVTTLLARGGSSSITSFSIPMRGGPCIVVIINMGKINGAAAVNGLTCRFGGTNGSMCLKTTSAFHTTTIRRLIV